MRHHLTSDLAIARNDTGRTAYCGPVVIAAITDFPVSRIEAAIRAHRAHCDSRPADEGDADAMIEGTTTEDVAAALAVFGYALEPVADYHHLERKARPTFWSWMQKPRNAWRHYLVAVHKGRQGHWICVKGTKMCDTFTNGAWTFVADGPHRGARIMEIYTVRQAH